MTRPLLFRLLIGASAIWAIWALWTVQGRSEPFTLSVIDDLGQPVAEAEVSWGGSGAATTDSDGLAMIQWGRGMASITVSRSRIRHPDDCRRARLPRSGLRPCSGLPSSGAR